MDNLKKLGYDVHWKVLSSLDFGLPQKRERWYCVGFDKKVNFEFPQPLAISPTLRDIEHGQNGRRHQCPGPAYCPA